MTRISVLVVAIVLAAASGCTDKKAQTSGKVSVVIGSVAPLTGGIAHLGKDNENGARLAIEEANAAGVKLDGKDVAAKYKTRKDAEAYLAKKIKEGSTGVWGPIPMPPNAGVNDEDAKTLAKYVLTVK